MPESKNKELMRWSLATCDDEEINKAGTSSKVTMTELWNITEEICHSTDKRADMHVKAVCISYYYIWFIEK